MEIFDAIPAPVVELCQRLRDNGKRGWVVGGCVRDLIRGAPAKDWDVATDARPEQVQRMFKRVIPTGIQHGTVTVLLRGEAYEVTTLRGEGAYTDGRRPEAVVFLDDITQDLARRDFTFNAIAIEPLERELVDPFGGVADLRAGVLRAVGKAEERFQEDGLRILRGARFAATLECDIDPATLTAMADPATLATLQQVSKERIHDEWMKAMRADRPSIAFDIMERTGVLDVCCPELRATVGNMSDGGVDAWTRSLRVMDALPKDGALRVAGLLHPLGAATTDEILRRLKFSNADRTRAVDVVREHDHGYQPSWSDSDVRRWLQRVTRKRIEDQLTFAIARDGDDASDLVDRARRLCADAVLTPGELCIRGADLIEELEIRPGPQVGTLLHQLVQQCIEDPSANHRETLLARARELLEPTA